MTYTFDYRTLIEAESSLSQPKSFSSRDEKKFTREAKNSTLPVVKMPTPATTISPIFLNLCIFGSLFLKEAVSTLMALC